ncbi:MAG: GTPase HflX [Promethearchaeota archaeon]
MTEPYKPTAILVERRHRGERSRIAELNTLAIDAGYNVVDVFEQIGGPNSAFQIGKGKTKELAELVKQLHPSKVIFENKLKPIQVYNLQSQLNCEVISKTELILEIFALRAGSKEAKLQIELARLRHELPRLKEYVSLSKKAELPGFHGPGTYAVEKHYESAKKRIKKIQNELEQYRKRRKVIRSRRKRKLDFSLVALVGYTNSGKSSLLNALTESSVPVANRLFTTLNTFTRSLSDKGSKILITDTVGLVDGLSHSMIRAFHSTLEELNLADVVVILVDLSDPIDEIIRKYTVCLQTLKDITVGNTKPYFIVANKVDLCDELEIKEKMLLFGNRVCIPASARQKTNLDSIKETIIDFLPIKRAFITVPSNGEAMRFISWLYDQAFILDQQHVNSEISFEIEASSQVMIRAKKYVDDLKGSFVIQMASK